MKKKTTKKLLLPALLMALCFTFMRPPVIPSNMPGDISTQVMPCSDDERDQNSNND